MTSREAIAPKDSPAMTTIIRLIRAMNRFLIPMLITSIVLFFTMGALGPRLMLHPVALWCMFATSTCVSVYCVSKRAPRRTLGIAIGLSLVGLAILVILMSS